MSFIFLIGCSSKKTNTDSELSLIKTNELRIDYIGNLTIIDEDQRHLLLQDIADSDKDRLLIVDKASQSTLKIFDRSGEGPEKFGIVWSACLGVKNNIWVWSRRGLFNYSREGDLLKKFNLDFLKHDYSFYTITNTRLFSYLNERNEEVVIFQAPNLGYLDTDFEYTNLFEACFLNSTNGAYFYAIKHPDNSFYSKNRFTPYFQSLPIMYLDRQHNKLTLKYPLDNYIYEYSVNEPFVSPLSIKVESDQVQANLQDVPISSRKNSYKSSFKLPQYSTLNLSSSFTLLGFDLGQNQNNIQYLLIDNDTREIQFEFNRPEEWLFLDHVDMDGNIYVKPNLVELFNTEPDYSIFFIYRLKKGG